MRTPTRLVSAIMLLALLAAPGTAARRRPRAPAWDGYSPPERTAASAPRPLPDIVFVSRPHGAAGAAGGARLLVRDSAGTLRDLLPAGAFRDVGHPDVSFDGRRVAFAGIAAGDTAWRIHVVGADGAGLAAVTRPDPGPTPYGDALEPCWVAPHHLVFVGTRAGRDAGARQLFLARDDGGVPVRLTAEPWDADGPAFDPAGGRLFFARRAAPGGPWRIVSLRPGLDDERLAAGDARQPDASLTQPAPLGDGRLAAVTTAADGTRVVLCGASAEPENGHGPGGGLPPALGTPLVLAGPRAGSPAALPGGRLLISYDPAGVGDRDLWLADAAPGDATARLSPLVDLRGTDETEGAGLAPTDAWSAPSDSALDARRPPGETRFGLHALNLFAGAPPDSPLPAPLPLADSLRLRVTAAPPGHEPVVRETDVSPAGEARVEGVPVDAPLVFALLGRDGRELLSAHHPGRSAWTNAAGAPERRCVGCHAGHSALPVPPDDEGARWFDAAPSARITASSSAPGTAGPRAATDRVTRGEPDRVAWIAQGGAGEWLRLSWSRPLELRELVLYGLRPAARGRATVRACEVVLRLRGAEISRRLVNVPLDPNGTHVGVGLTVADELEIDVTRVAGSFDGRRAAALAEIETVARVP